MGVRLLTATLLAFLLLAAQAQAQTVNRIELYAAEAGASPSIVPIGPDANLSLVFQPKGNGSVAIPVGRLGIGTSTPAYALEVTGTTGISVNGPLSVNRNPIYLATYNDLNHAIGNGMRSYTVGGSATVDGETFNFFKYLDLFSKGGKNASTLFINGENGNVGINTTAPAATLHVTTTGGVLGRFDTSAIGGYMQLVPSNDVAKRVEMTVRNDGAYGSLWADGDRLVWTRTGKVGINTQTPHETLSISNGHEFHTGGNLVHAFNAHYLNNEWNANGYGGTAYGALVDFSPANGVLRLAVSTAAAAADAAFTIPYASLVVTKDNMVGIGVFPPAATLDVNGYMKLRKNTVAPAACNGTYDGAIALTSARRMCVCNGTAWTEVNSANACAW